MPETKTKSTTKTTSKATTSVDPVKNSTRLYRSQTDQMIAGVAAGIAEHFDLDPTLIRLAFVLITLIGGSGVIVYIILWIILPTRPNVSTEPEETIHENLEEIKDRAHAFATRTHTPHSRSLWGLLFIIFGLIFLLQNFGLFFHINLWQFWPIIIIIIGFSILSKDQ
jgi:phage shock protein C